MRGLILIVFVLSLRAQSLPAIPEVLKAPAGERMVRQVRAEGDQVYACDGASWVLARPDAKLFDETGKQVGTHFAADVESVDGSRVVGKAAANATPDPDSIPWLLVKAADHQGEGWMKGVTSIQRLSTKGGKAPATGCDAQHKGQATHSHYRSLEGFKCPAKSRMARRYTRGTSLGVTIRAGRGPNRHRAWYAST